MKNIHFLFLFILFALLQNAQLFTQDSLLIWSKMMPDVFDARFSLDNSTLSLNAGNNIILKIPSGEIDTILSGAGHCEYTQDGKYLICASDKIRIYDSKTYEQLGYVENDQKEISDLSIAPNNMICARFGGSGFRIWDFKTGKIIKNKVYGRTDTIYHTGDILYGINALCYANNGRYLIVNKVVITLDSKNNPVLLDEYAMILDTNSLDSIGVIKTAKGITGMISSKTGRYLAYSFGERVRIYEFATNSMIYSIVGIPYKQGIDFSADDMYIGLTPWGIDIFNIISKQKFYNYNTGNSTSTLAFSYDNKYIFIKNTSGEIYLYRTPWITSVAEPKNTINATFIYPNPSENYIILSFDLLQPNHTSIYLTDLKGMKIKDVLNDYIDIGNHKISIDLNNIASGPYFLTINSGTDSFCSKIIINK